MRIDTPRGLAGLGLVASTIPWALGCAPVCYDDGALQKDNCPAEMDTEVASGSASQGSGSTGIASAEGTGGSGMMSAEGTGGDSLDGTTAGVECPGFQEVIVPETRTFQFVVERGGLMANDFDGVSRYDAIADVLFDGVDGVVTAQQADTRFGMVLFRGEQLVCPDVVSEPPQLDASPVLAGLMAMSPPGGFNAVADSIDVAVTELAADPAAGEKTMILLTTTEPGTCDISFPANAADLAITRSAAIDAVEAGVAMGFPVRVVALDQNIDSSYLQLLANAGNGNAPGDPDATYWQAEDRAELTTAIEEITATSRECTFMLGDPISDELAPNCEVVVNGAPVTYEDADGWNLPNDQTLELQGAACDSIQQGLATINMTCSCDA